MNSALADVSPRAETVTSQTPVFLDLTHLGRHVTGIERVSIEQFQNVEFTDAAITHVRSHGVVSMVWCQQVWLPWLALMNPRATFVFPGFPPSPLFALFWRNRTVLYVHDLFLITRRGDLGRNALLYMAGPFAFAVRRLRRFQVNSAKTAAELATFVRSDAEVASYRPGVRNVFGLSAAGRAERPPQLTTLRIATLGTVEPRKNYAAMLPLIDALARATGQDVELHIIGREGWGEAKDALKGHARVTIHGYLAANQVKATLEACDLYLCTSHDEGLGLPLLEAQYAGLAVVAPDKPVFHEVLADSGTFIDPARPIAAADEICRLIAAPGWRVSTTAAAVANVARWNGLAAHDATTVRAMFKLPNAAR